jgi:hypothetical protein
MSIFIEPVLHLAHNLYSAMWSNMWAPSVWTLFGMLVADLRNHRRSQLLKSSHVDTIASLGAQLQVMSDKLNALIGDSNDDTQQPG